LVPQSSRFPKRKVFFVLRELITLFGDDEARVPPPHHAAHPARTMGPPVWWSTTLGKGCVEGLKVIERGKSEKKILDPWASGGPFFSFERAYGGLWRWWMMMVLTDGPRVRHVLVLGRIHDPSPRCHASPPIFRVLGCMGHNGSTEWKKSLPSFIKLDFKPSTFKTHLFYALSDFRRWFCLTWCHINHEKGQLDLFLIV
jgi:hypothetical protein